MIYAKKELPSEAFGHYSGVRPETFEAMLGVLREVEQDKKKVGRSSKLGLEEELLLMRPLGRV
jgi:hypothetical protein